MERISKRTWQKHLRPKDVSALLLVLSIALAVVAVVSLVLF